MNRTELIVENESLRKAVAHSIWLEDDFDSLSQSPYTNSIIRISEILGPALSVIKPLAGGYDEPDGTAIDNNSASTLYDAIVAARGEIYRAAQNDSYLKKLMSKKKSSRHYIRLKPENRGEPSTGNIDRWVPSEEDWDKVEKIYGPLKRTEDLSDQELYNENRMWMNEIMADYISEEESQRDLDLELTSLLEDLHDLLWGVDESVMDLLHASKSKKKLCHLDPYESYDLYWAIAESLIKLRDLPERDPRWINVLNLTAEI